MKAEKPPGRDLPLIPFSSHILHMKQMYKCKIEMKEAEMDEGRSYLQRSSLERPERRLQFLADF